MQQSSESITRGILPRLNFRLFLVSVMILGACGSPKPVEGVKGAIVVTGTMNFLAIEGGCWVLQAGANVEELTAYLLETDNEEEFNKVTVDGARVKVQIVPRPKMASVCQIGIVATLVKVLEVQVPSGR